MKKQEPSDLKGVKKETGGEKITQKPARKGKTPKEIVDEHIRNKHDVISDEEFKNLDLSLDTESDVAHEPLDLPEKKQRPKDEDKDPDKFTPWDVLND